MPIHPTAIVDRRAEVDPTADIGPYVVIDGPVTIGAGTRILPHATITGWTTLGRDNVVHMGAVLGDEPQDLGYTGFEAHVRIGDRNVFREHSQVHRSKRPGGATVIGDDNFFMTNVHVGHDSVLGNRIVMATGAVLGGHVEVGDAVNISGNCVVHQFVRIGRLAFLRGLSRAPRDVPPFCMMDFTSILRGLNTVGLRRAGFTREQLLALRAAYKTLFFTRRNLRIALAEVEAGACSAEVGELVEFVRASKRGVSRGGRGGEAGEEQ